VAFEAHHIKDKRGIAHPTWALCTLTLLYNPFVHKFRVKPHMCDSLELMLSASIILLCVNRVLFQKCVTIP